MKQRSWTLGAALVAAAVVAPQRVHSVSWTLTAKVYEVHGTVPDGIGLDSPVTVAWTYDPDAATATEGGSCEQGQYYEFTSAPGVIQVTIGAMSWSHELQFLQMQDDGECSVCYDTRADAFLLSSGDVLTPGTYVWVVDCYPPLDLLNSSVIPRNPGDLNLDAALAVGFVWGSGWAISFVRDDPKPVTSSTWTAVKSLYR